MSGIASPRPDRWLSVLAFLLCCTALPALAAKPPPPPEQVFQVSASATGAETLEVRLRIEPGYYLYRDKLRLRTDTSGIALGPPVLPAAEIKEDRYFGQVPIYRHDTGIQIPFTRGEASVDSLDLEVDYQGCADAGLCYPPQHQRLRIALPPPDAAAADPGLLAPRSTSRLGLGRSLAAGRIQEVPPVEDAFRFQARVAAPDRLELSWDIAPGTYLYRHLLEVALEDTDAVTLGAVERPAGEHKDQGLLPNGELGAVDIYHDRVELGLPLVRGAAGEQRVTLVARYQGCADAGVCYPPQVQRVTLALPATAAAGPAEPEPAASAPATTAPTAVASGVAEQDLIAATLAHSNLWAVVAIFFGFGLLLAFTPCVFPMIPILSGIIVGHGVRITTRKAFLLSTVYVLAMAATYTLVGILAGLFGANLQAFFQDPWILVAFALVFVALALSMFGFYDLQIPSTLQSRLAMLSNRQHGGTLLGAAVMGLLSALIVGPCVAPPLFGALIYISQTGDAALGGLALFALSLGMGAPLIVIGTSAGRLLPRAGVWMDAIKAVFGVVLLGIAIQLLERILPPALSMALWGLLLICSAVYMGALTHLPPGSGGWSKLWKGLGLVLLIYGALMLLGTAAGGKDTLQPLRGIALPEASRAAEPVSFQRIKTVADLQQAVRQTAGRPVMLDFRADWCVSCKELERYTFSDPAVMTEMRRFLRLQADVTANDADDRALMQKTFGIPGPPAILFLTPDGVEMTRERLVGFVPADVFAAHLRRIAP